MVESCYYGIVNVADNWECKITKDIYSGQAWLESQPIGKCEWGVV